MKRWAVKEWQRAGDTAYYDEHGRRTDPVGYWDGLASIYAHLADVHLDSGAARRFRRLHLDARRRTAALRRTARSAQRAAQEAGRR